MDSRKDQIFKIFAILMLHLYLRSATATNIDCNGKSFHCVNSTHFVICVDLGGGVSTTVNDFVIQCPATTVCSEKNHLECTYELPMTTQSTTPSDETKDFTTDTDNSSFTTEKNISEPSLPTTKDKIKDIENISNLSDGTTLSGDPYFIKLTDTTYDTTQSTTYLSNETKYLSSEKKDFTTDTGITTKFSNDITNTISSTNETSVTGFFNEYFNLIEVTTSANYEPNVQTYKNTGAGMPEMLNKDKPATTIDHSNGLMATTDTVFQNIGNSSFITEKNISEPSLTTTTIKDIENISNLSDGTTLSGDPYFITLTDTTQSTTYLSNETKDLSSEKKYFTTDTGITTTFSNDITNTISSTNNTSVTGLLKEYLNKIDVTTLANYERDVQTYKYEISAMPDILNNDKQSTSYNNSNSLTETPEINSAKSNNSLNIKIPTKGYLFQNNLNLSFTTEKNILVPSFATTTINDIEITTNFSDGTTLSGDPYLIKLTEITYDTTIETTTRDLSTWMDQDANTLEHKVIQNTQNSDVVTKSLPEMIHTTQPTLLTPYPWVQENNYYEKISDQNRSGIENLQTSTLFDRDDQKIHEILLENSLTSVNPTQVTKLVTPEENISEINLTNTDSSNFTSTKMEGNIKLSTEANVMENITQMKLNKTLSIHDLNVSEITESKNKTNMPSTLEPKITSSVYITETKGVVENSTVSKISFHGNEMFISPKGDISSTVHSPVTLENHVDDELKSKFTVPKIEMTSFDYKLNSENSITTPTVNKMGKKIQNTITEKISPDDILEGASTIKEENSYFDHITSPIDYRTTISELNFSEQNIHDNKSNMIPLYEQHILEVPVLSDVSTTYANINKLLTTLDLTTKSMEPVTETNEANKITAPYSIDVNGKIMLQNENANQMNTVSGHDNYNSYEITTEISKLNTNSQSITVMITETSLNTTEYSKLLSEKEKELQISPSFTENPTNKSDLNLEEQVIRGNKTFPSFPREKNIFKTSFPENSPTSNTESSLSNYDFSISSLPSKFEQATITESLTGRKQAIESTTSSYYNKTPYFSQYKNATETLANYSTQSEYLVSDIEQRGKNETTSTFHKEDSTSNPGVQDNIEKTSPLNNISTIKDSMVTNPGTYEVVSNIKVHESITLKPEHTPMAVSEYTMINNVQLNEVHPISNSDLNSNTKPLSQDEKSTFIVRQDSIFTVTENYNTLDLSQDTENSIHGDVNLLIMSSTGVDKYVRKNVDKVTTGEKIYGTQNQQSLNDTIRLISHDSNIQTTATSVAKEDVHDQMTTGVVSKTYQVTDNPNDMVKNRFVHVINSKDQEMHANVNHIDDNLTEKVISNETEVTIQNQEASNDTMRLILQDQNMQSSEKLSPSTPKYLMTTLVSKEDEIFSIHNQITTGVVTKNYQARDNPNDMVINTTNDMVKHSYIHVRNNIDQEIHVNVNHIDDYLTDKVVSPVLNILNSKIPSEFVESGDSVNSVQKKATSINITDDFINKKQSNVLSENSSVQLKYNNSVKVSNTINDSSTVTSTTISESKSNLLHTVQNNHNNTTNNANIKNGELNATNEERISNKRSVVVNTEIPKYDTMSVIEKSNAVFKNRITTTGKTPLVHVSLNSDSKSEINTMVTEGTGDLYVENRKALKEQNSTEVTTNNTSYSNIPTVPIRYLGSVKKIPYKPPVEVNQTSLDAKQQTLPEENLHLNSTYQSNHKAVAIDHTNKENLPVTPRVISNANKRFFPTESRRKMNVGIKANNRSTNSTLFRCNLRIRGRFADKNNCRKFYICIGKNKPILGECPSNTVFSEIKKQCTKNLSHCIRNNQFRCTQEGRFGDVLRSNIYYICVNNKNAYVRFTFQCQNGFHLNKTSVRCVKDIHYESQMSIDSISFKDQSTVESKSKKTKQGQMSIDSISYKDQSTVEIKSKKKNQVKEDAQSICSKEGKFPDGEDCRRYYVCSKNSKSVFRRRTKKCDSDEVFHREKKKCVDRESYECI